MSDSNPAGGGRSEAELQASIEQIRSNLSQTLETLSYQAQPRVQLEAAQEAVERKADEVKQDLAATFRGCLEGDRDSIIAAAKIVGVTAGVTIGVTSLLVLRHRHRKIRRGEVQQWRRLVRQLGKITPPASLTFVVE